MARDIMGPDRPEWIYAGLAQYIASQAEPTGPDFRREMRSAGIMYDADQWEEALAGGKPRAYVQAFLLVDYLVRQSSLKLTIDKLHTIPDRSNAAAQDRALQEAFGYDLPRLLQAWWDQL